MLSKTEKLLAALCAWLREVPALVYLYCLALPGSCLARFAYFLADLCREAFGRLLSKSAYRVALIWDKWLLYKRSLVYRKERRHILRANRHKNIAPFVADRNKCFSEGPLDPSKYCSWIVLP